MLTLAPSDPEVHLPANLTNTTLICTLSASSRRLQSRCNSLSLRPPSPRATSLRSASDPAPAR